MKNLSGLVTVTNDHRDQSVRPSRGHFTDDHEPAHVHVFGDGHAKINLLGDPELVWAEGMTRGEVRKAMRLVSEHQALLLAKWREIHG